MGKITKILIGLLVVTLLGFAGAYWFVQTMDARETSRVAFAEHCAACHGLNLEGGDSAPALVGVPLKQGDDIETLIHALTNGHKEIATKTWQQDLPPAMIKAVALFVSEQRQQFPTTFESYQTFDASHRVSSQYHHFSTETVAELKSRPYSMAALPDGGFLVVEKTRGLSVVDKQGNQSELIKNTPKVWSELVSVKGVQVALGTMLDVALHPDYEHNGFIYLSHAERCQLDCGSPWPVSMVRVVRGRIENGTWVDNEEIWSVHHDFYTPTPDNVACGRLAFDNDHYLYITVGGKWTYDNLHKMDTPYGKIHRVTDDGRVPEDNPFWQNESDRPEVSSQHTIWSYGHRTAQGLAAHPLSGDIWSTEMGPRGGDEVNKIERGGNYGWPLYTNGIDYNGTPVSIGEDLGLDFPYEETIPPVVDFTPAPAVSNLTFYHGDRFEQWNNDLLVGSLKAQTLYRLRIENGQLVEQEKLLTKLGRIRDVEVGADGLVYVVVEHKGGGALIRLTPDTAI